MATKETKKVTLQISGMTCALCVAHNEKALGELPGVEKVVVNLATDKATVEYDPAQTTLEEVVGAVLGDGREMRTVTDGDKRN